MPGIKFRMRRRFFLLAAPAIVAAPSLMKVSALAMPPAFSFSEFVTATLKAREPYIIENVRLHNSLLARVVSNKILYGSSIYSGYDGYQIIHDNSALDQQSA